MQEWLQVLKAADSAARWHVHQRRKGPAEEPYINHLVEVVMLVANATGGKDTNLVIAALLHDAMEYCEVPTELITETFGDDVASLVEEVTDDKSLPKAVRKDEQVKTAPTKSSRAKILKLADKISNLRAIASSAPSDWSVKRRLEYVRWASEVAKGLRGVNQKLEEQFDNAAAAAERRAFCKSWKRERPCASSAQSSPSITNEPLIF
jgi:GTP diphosphokinase / guanosine-3',5'-bis(diphosphate) 3'-diphosphatase